MSGPSVLIITRSVAEHTGATVRAVVEARKSERRIEIQIENYKITKDIMIPSG